MRDFPPPPRVAELGEVKALVSQVLKSGKLVLLQSSIGGSSVARQPQRRDRLDTADLHLLPKINGGDQLG